MIDKNKKGAKKKAVDPLTREEWYDVFEPAEFDKQHVGKTVVNRTLVTRIASNSQNGHVYAVTLGDLNSDGEFPKLRRICRVSRCVATSKRPPVSSQIHPVRASMARIDVFEDCFTTELLGVLRKSSLRL